MIRFSGTPLDCSFVFFSPQQTLVECDLAIVVVAVENVLTSPVDGCVLKLLEESERVVPPGTPVLEIGYSPKLEIVSDFLTEHAVKIRSGMLATIEDWGGDKPLQARVRTVEPGAFTKISALGVEEQRVNVVLDFTSRIGLY